MGSKRWPVWFATLISLSAILAPAPAGARNPAGAHVRTVFLIVMENHNWASIRGSSSAPYINGTLLRLGAHAERYYNPPHTHPSLPNYLWLEAGTGFGIKSDLLPSAVGRKTTRHLVTLLTRAHVSWKAYEEGIGGGACPLVDRGLYAAKHNPMIYFDDVTGGNNPASATCIAHERPFAELARDLGRNTVARYNFITPNLCNDMHDVCAPLHDSIQQGDLWLSKVVPTIMSSRAYRRGGAIFIVWDEAEQGDGPIGMILLSPYARKGYAAHTVYTHSSTLRTLEEVFGVTPLLRGAAQAQDLRELFTTFP